MSQITNIFNKQIFLIYVVFVRVVKSLKDIIVLLHLY